jgi:hypothetical protein
MFRNGKYFTICTLLTNNETIDCHFFYRYSLFFLQVGNGLRDTSKNHSFSQNDQSLANVQEKKLKRIGQDNV